MKVLIIGGTRFIGPRLARLLIAAGNEVILFHRGQTEADLPASVKHIYGDRRLITTFTSEFRQIAPEVVVDMICYSEREASGVMQAFNGIARRIVVASSMDVYKAYGCLLGLETGPPEPGSLEENAPLRVSRFPYRKQAKSQDDMAYDYEKILVEQVVMSNTGLPGTVLRLPAVYGPGDHRAFEYLRRMEDGRPRILLDENHARWRWTRGYVDDIAEALVLAVTDDRATNRIYNVGEPNALTEAEWIRSIGRAARWNGDVIPLRKEFMPAHLAAPYNFDHHLQGDTRKIRAELGYSESVSRDEAIMKTVQWERAHPPEQIDPARFDYIAEDAAIAESSSRKKRCD